MLLLPAVLSLVIVAILFRALVRRITVFEFERGVLYRRGRSAGTLEPGVHWLWFSTTIVKVDIRPTFLTVPGQEVLSADGAGLKLTAVAKYQVADPERALNSVAAYRDALYTQMQLGLRAIVGAAAVDTVLTTRPDLGKALTKLVSPKLAEFGVTLLEAEVKDLMFPGDFKKIFAQVIKARQEGLAALSPNTGPGVREHRGPRTRRSAANAAAPPERNPTQSGTVATGRSRTVAVLASRFMARDQTRCHIWRP